MGGGSIASRVERVKRQRALAVRCQEKAHIILLPHMCEYAQRLCTEQPFSKAADAIDN
jgi:hypothetical protein